jgi:hypothetical protein
MEHQYPGAISSDESMLAELMLPDQTHVRSQDWTIFFLHKDTSTDGDEEEPTSGKKKKRKRKEDRTQTSSGDEEDSDGLDDNSQESTEDEQSSDEEDGGEGPPLMYVLNLVNTKQDNTVKRYGPGFNQSSTVNIRLT